MRIESAIRIESALRIESAAVVFAGAIAGAAIAVVESVFAESDLPHAALRAATAIHRAKRFMTYSLSSGYQPHAIKLVQPPQPRVGRRGNNR